MGKVAALISGKGGTGKTSLSANLAAALSLMGQKTIVIDGDAGLRNLDLLFALEDKIKGDFGQVIKGQIKAEEAIMSSDSFPGLDILPAASQGHKFPVFETTELIRQFKNQYDWVIIDCPAGLGDFFRIAVNQADLLICVVNPDIASVQNGRKALAEARQHSKAEPFFVLNKVEAELLETGQIMSLEAIASILPAVLLGLIPYDLGFLKAANLGVLLMSDDEAAATAAIRRSARRLLGERVKIIVPRGEKKENQESQEKGFLAWLKKSFK